MDNDMIEMNRSMLEKLIRGAYRDGRRTKATSIIQYAIDVVEAVFPKPLRFCDLKVGDMFEFEGDFFTKVENHLGGRANTYRKRGNILFGFCPTDKITKVV